MLEQPLRLGNEGSAAVRSEPHTAQEPHGALDLLPFLRTAPVQLVGHDVDYAREGIEGRLGVHEGEPGSAGEDVNGGLCVFVSDGVADFGFDIWGKGKGQAAGELWIQCDGLHGYRGLSRMPCKGQLWPVG